MIPYTRLSFFFLLLLAWAGCAGFRHPYDQYGNPSVASLIVRRDTLPSCSLSCYYYTISNNIENPGSYAYVSRRPGNAQVLAFAQAFPSYFFVVAVDSQARALVGFNQACNGGSCDFSYHIVIPAEDKVYDIPSKLEGKLTQYRATELRYQGYDTTAHIDSLGGTAFLTFGGERYEIQPLDKVVKEVEQIIEKENLSGKH
jgi:hypothetical protein